ncbi:MAG: hypothetical protein OXI81_05770 [Paracoccaceae bacterium]|nr:hypothetical protein [Paracoccaceae bacterium]MDE2913557.1 hypothetical protein [Paracoccaceae bacterium]
MIRPTRLVLAAGAFFGIAFVSISVDIPGPATAQSLPVDGSEPSASAEPSLSTTPVDREPPIETTADEVSIIGRANTIQLRGNATVSQGNLVLKSESIDAVYDPESRTILLITASGTVSFTNGQESATALSGTYRVPDAILVLEGDATLLQGLNRISADRIVINVETGDATFEGQVSSVLIPTSGE